MDVSIDRPHARFERAFLDAARRSRESHAPWVSAPQTPAEFRAYLKRTAAPTHEAFFLTAESDLVGVINVTEIVRGNFQSGYLSYYLFVPYLATGCMRAGLARVITHCFQHLGLNRLEANIQPANARSKALVSALGFRLEGLSERYLKINGQWRDHERWAVHAEEWASLH